MHNKFYQKGLIEKKLENPEYRKLHEETYEAFKLEVQILNALENKGWTYSKLAEATRTAKSNISRDLKSGGILSATFSRISRIADALGMKLIALLIPKEQESFIMPKIEDLVRGSLNTLGIEPKTNITYNSAYNINNTYVTMESTGEYSTSIISKTHLRGVK